MVFVRAERSRFTIEKEEFSKLIALVPRELVSERSNYRLLNLRATK